MKFQVLIIIGIVLLNTSCKSDKSLNKDRINIIHLNATEKAPLMSEDFSELRYILFKFNEKNIPIGEITDIKDIDNEIILKQRLSTQVIFQRFSNNGIFLNNIGEYGRGANEIFNPRDIVIHNHDFAVWDNNGIHLISKSGKYIAHLFNVLLSGKYFFYSANKFFFLHELTSPGFLTMYSEKGKLEKIYMPNNFDVPGLDNPRIFKLGIDYFHIFSPVVDTIYSYHQEKLSSMYIIDGGPNKTFGEVLQETKNMNPLEQLKTINKIHPVSIISYLENMDYIFVAYRVKDKLYNLIIKKENWETKYFTTYKNDIDGGLWGTPLLLTNDNVLYIPLYPHEILNHIPDDKYKVEFDEFKKQFQLYDNPILMLCKLK
jgi:hypothetical protein